MERQFNSFKEFYPYYLEEHSKTGTRILHFIGTFLVIAILIYAIYYQKWLLLISVPIVGYGFAWVSHLMIEKNKPATFKYPLYSLGSDFVMFWHLIIGKEKF
jgi:hypothetical protein